MKILQGSGVDSLEPFCYLVFTNYKGGFMEQLENNSTSPLIGEVQCPNERLHIFTNIDALTDFVKVFKIYQFNVRYGQNAKGQMVFQLVYRSEQE